MSRNPLPPVGLGTWQLVGRECEEVVARALDLGYRHVDTAAGYENEAAVGRALARSGLGPGSLWVTTKIWVDGLSAEAVAEAAAASADRLGLEAVDLLLVHWPPRETPLEAALEGLATVLERGRARAVGASNFPIALLERAARAGVRLLCNQIECHPYLTQPRLRAWMHGHGIALAAYSPLAHGRVGTDPALAAVARRRAATPAQIALAWLAGTLGASVLPKASSEAHLRENLASLDLALEPEEVRTLAALERGERLFDPEFAPAWDD